jgi:predicted ATPase/class 3 adenylate cyclase
MARALPGGTVTFMFTDIEGSTRLLQELGDKRYAAALEEHRRAVRAAVEAHAGVEVDTQGDAFFFAFPTAPGALRAAADARERLASGGPIRVRMGLHTGTPLLTDEGYVGGDVHRAARIAACGHGGQVLVSSSTASLVDPGALSDLGEHRLKDLTAPERIYQLGADEFPTLKSLYRTNLPVPATPFLGRETELGEVYELLAREDVRLLTLTGPGGTGKTRLALQSAGAVADLFPDGVYWVPLAPLHDPQLVLQGAAQVVGADDGLAEHIADRRLLLLLDNFEHLTEAASDAAGLLATCPNLRLLVTSREPLHVSGEQEYPVPPLAAGEALDFFTTRARTVKPDFRSDESVPAICSRLDDLPLALELAAARVKALAPSQILERLERRLPLLTGGARDAPERQRTLRATIDWSHDLLTDREQRLYARLAVFRGGCNLDAAEQIADADLDTLQSLVDKSLVRHNEGRYWMLETIREHASERLEAAGEADGLRRRHASYFLQMAEAAHPELRLVEFRGTGDVVDVLERDHDNFRAALDYLTDAGETRQVLQLAGALAEFWFRSDYWAELRVRLLGALHAETGSSESRARALLSASDVVSLGGDLEESARFAEEALAFYRQSGDRRGVGDALIRIGATFEQRGDLAGAQPFFEEARALYREVGDQDALLTATRILAWTLEQAGDLDRANALYADNLERSRAIGNPLIYAASLGWLATLDAERGRFDEAFASAREHLPIACALGNAETATALMRVARVLLAAGRAIDAARILATADAMFAEMGITEFWAVGQVRQLEAALHDALDETELAAIWEDGRARTPDAAVALALDVLGSREP